MLKRHLPTALLALALFLGIHAWQTRGTPEQAPTALMEWLATQPIDASQPVFGVYVWAEWCSICKLQEGTIDALQAESPVVTIAMQSGTSDRVHQTLSQRGIQWLTLADPHAEMSRALGASVVPYFLVVDRRGRILSSTSGFTTPWGLRARLWFSRVGL
ncbi:MAG: hypothetical protein RL133_547 [Pseudomonadota bacterium]